MRVDKLKTPLLNRKEKQDWIIHKCCHGSNNKKLHSCIQNIQKHKYKKQVNFYLLKQITHNLEVKKSYFKNMF